MSVSVAIDQMGEAYWRKPLSEVELSTIETEIFLGFTQCRQANAGHKALDCYLPILFPSSRQDMSSVRLRRNRNTSACLVHDGKLNEWK